MGELKIDIGTKREREEGEMVITCKTLRTDELKWRASIAENRVKQDARPSG